MVAIRVVREAGASRIPSHRTYVRFTTRWLPSPATALSCLLAGFVAPYFGPVLVVRYCPGQARYSFPFLFAKEVTAATDVTMLLGVVANTLIGALAAIVAVTALKRLPLAALFVTKLRNQRPTILTLLGVVSLGVVVLGVETITASADVWPGHVDTDACRHVSGHAFVPNWWGPNRFDLLALDRFGLG